MTELARKNNLLLGMLVSLFKLSLGFITYPLYLHYLNPVELSIFFLFVGTSSIIELLDFGFYGSITRYFAYSSSKPIEYKVNILLKISQAYYRWICIIAFFVVVVGFGIYLYFFTNLHHARFINYLLIWLLYGTSVLIGIYFMYLSPLLIGFGFIDKVNKISLISRIIGLVIQVVFIIAGYGLVSIAIGALCSTIVERVMLLEAVQKLSLDICQTFEHSDYKKVFKEIWSVNYKLGLISLAWLFIAKINVFIAGMIIKDITLLSEYLFSFQMITILLAIAHVPISNRFGDISSYYVSNKTKAMSLFFKSNQQSIWFMLLCTASLLLFGNATLTLLNFKHSLLNWHYLLVICIMYLLEKQLINHSTMISIRNEVPMLKSYLVTAIMVVVITIICAEILHIGIWSVILPQLICQSCFNYWYWIKYNLSRENIKFTHYAKSFYTKSI